MSLKSQKSFPSSVSCCGFVSLPKRSLSSLIDWPTNWLFFAFLCWYMRAEKDWWANQSKLEIDLARQLFCFLPLTKRQEIKLKRLDWLLPVIVCSSRLYIAFCGSKLNLQLLCFASEHNINPNNHFLVWIEPNWARLSPGKAKFSFVQARDNVTKLLVWERKKRCQKHFWSDLHRLVSGWRRKKILHLLTCFLITNNRLSSLWGKNWTEEDLNSGKLPRDSAGNEHVHSLPGSLLLPDVACCCQIQLEASLVL